MGQTVCVKDRVAIVTGAGSGLGRAYALELARRQAKVVVNDLGCDRFGEGASASLADHVVEEIRTAGGEAVPDHHSVADSEGGNAMVQTALDHYGTVDILINNAGIGRRSLFHEMPMEDFRLLIDVHVMGTAYATRAVWPVMREKGYGRVVITSSGGGLYGSPGGFAHYGTAKLGVVGLVNALATDCLESGIRVNAVAPIAATRLTGDLFPPGMDTSIWRPELVAPAAVYLASDECELNGCVIVAAAGHFALSRIVETPGYQLDPHTEVTAEQFAAHVKEVTDMSGAQPFPDSLQAAGKLFASLMKVLDPEEVMKVAAQMLEFTQSEAGAASQ